MLKHKLFTLVILSSLIAAEASAFGTIRKNGVIPQDREHERITRRAYSCDIPSRIKFCMDPKTLDKMAGKKRLLYGTYGGVGYPDKLVNVEVADEDILSDYSHLPSEYQPRIGLSLPSIAVAHCDNGDHLSEIADYPQSEDKARDILSGCRLWMNDHFNAAVDAAAGLVKDGQIVVSATKLKSNCITWDKKELNAKCKVLTHFGIMLHAAQDFYSHSNWNDKAASDAISSFNPPGMSKTGPAPWLKMPISDDQFPAGLISGCWGGWPEKYHCEITSDVHGTIRQTKHKDVNKDHGVVDPKGSDEAQEFPDVGRIGPGKSSRGKINQNFERAIHATIMDSRAKLDDFNNALILKYGDADAALMMCAITKDKPKYQCK